MITKTTSVQERSEKKHFDSIANKYDKNYGYTNLFTKYKISRKVNDFVNFVTTNHPKGNIKLLEIGCGTGEYTKLISQLLPQSKITALDISKESLLVAKKKCSKSKNIKFVVGSAYALKAKKESFDVVFGYYILHHLKIDKVGRELYKVLKKGGVGFFYEPNIINPYVFLVKSVPFIKRRVGDSPDEWAVNPFTVNRLLSKFRTKILFSEYIFPVSFLSLKTLIWIDKCLLMFSRVPIFKFLGGSLQINIFKKLK